MDKNKNAYIDIFFDTEFTHFENGAAKSELISIGFASECGKTFYAESKDFDYGLCSQFVVDNVLPHLEGGTARMPLVAMVRGIKDFINGFDKPVLLISDAPDFDWPLLERLFFVHGFPDNMRLTNTSSNQMEVMSKPVNGELKKIGASGLIFYSDSQRNLFLEHLKSFRNNPGFRHHHALDDAVANMQAYQKSF